jgi:hypothetical protein
VLILPYVGATLERKKKSVILLTPVVEASRHNSFEARSERQFWSWFGNSETEAEGIKNGKSKGRNRSKNSVFDQNLTVGH